ncbi:unnamed protein product [Chrysodeixis includens]|uniref:TIL domain-containing protein n=1 Tax=Chrysodeixis includens TaxID=689277 RepID=A0A9P0C4F6_CHRIL|nr:unnamed protein product [Chrysodeixis includens]
MLRLLIVLFCGHVVLCRLVIPDIGQDKCKPEEVLQCFEKCPGEVTCRNRDVIDRKQCPDVVEPCVLKCICREGLFRSDDGSCLDKKQCEKSLCSENEFYDCGHYCDNTCAAPEQNRTNCPNTEHIKCRPRCYCKDGFARDVNGFCIPVEGCELDLKQRRERDPNLPPCCKTAYGFPLDFENN